jgi:hypothetical protein
MHKVRAKFQVTGKQKYEPHDPEDPRTQILMEAVTQGSEENKIFGKWTPCGYLNLYLSDSVAEYFEPGKEYYLDFIRHEDDKPIPQDE